jgi:DnaJ-class molecular chaperone
MEHYKTCKQCGGSGIGEKMLDMDRYHQCPKCAGRGKYYDVALVTEMMPAMMYMKQTEVVNKLIR